MYPPNTSPAGSPGPFGPPPSLPPLRGGPPPLAVDQPVFKYASLETPAAASAKKLKVVAGVLGLLSVLLLAATITLGVLYGTKGGETTVTVAPT
eukprot:CAMPEP_0174346726 /NCGR_PEP_ID=MMETSP0811_2-20130205/2535_1 /TAXON_ID=73025 ORGANISM="Eutreptiella gymnastica-like, Strain CCMP1594" /NCGR_SAMPLE_ID=MMETSP0811_2 /ASSEMBLY_ACC=CAM_ASM_000667 /LENGTH=93 /DNA_ID=CAMNT_0015471559 /DNA_START=20 /DNA_END=297 /DNA_ORIENTATION=+